MIPQTNSACQLTANKQDWHYGYNVEQHLYWVCYDCTFDCLTSDCQDEAVAVIMLQLSTILIASEF